MKTTFLPFALASLEVAKAATLSNEDYRLVPDGTEIGSLENDPTSQLSQLNTSTLAVAVVNAAQPDA